MRPLKSTSPLLPLLIAQLTRPLHSPNVGGLSITQGQMDWQLQLSKNSPLISQFAIETIYPLNFGCTPLFWPNFSTLITRNSNGIL